MNRVFAVIVAVLYPVAGLACGNLSPEQVIRTTLLFVFPLLLIFKPPFIRNYFRSGITPIVIGWFAFAAIFTQAFLFPIWFRIR